MNYNPTPKSEFVKSPENIKAHHALLEDAVLRKHLEVALSELGRRIADNSPPEMGACAAAHLRMLGAHDFVEIFLNLGETVVLQVKGDNLNLPSNVKSMTGKN
jgi:hypothetical protein